MWFRLWYKQGTGPWLYIDETYTAAAVPALTSHTTGDTLSASVENFSWSDPTGTVNDWWLYVGSSQGGLQYENTGYVGWSTSYSVTGLLTDSESVFALLWYRVGSGPWEYIDYEFSTSD